MLESDNMGHCPRCDSGEVDYEDTPDLRIDTDMEQICYFAGKCEICGCEFKEIYSMVYINTIGENND